MCGISGIHTFGYNESRFSCERSIQKMMELMVRRGPDSYGQWNDPLGNLYLGFRRLAVLDLTSAGDQPMISQDGQSVIVFNGEIYNFEELRSELKGHGVRFRSRSDTEVLLEALNRWGKDVLPRLNGMFAFAWYDRTNRTLLLARDHAGIKPLYYFLPRSGKGLVFASQFNCLLHSPLGVPGQTRLDVLRLYLRLHHIPTPYGILEDTYQLEPGHFLSVQADGEIQKGAWWQLPRNPEPDLRGGKALEALSEAMANAVHRQRISDVPLGVFLSGGVDSPLVAAVLREQSGSGLKAFNIGNPGWHQDESEDAKRFASHLKVSFRSHPVSGNEALDRISDVMLAQHEPFADFSILPTLMVCEHARKDVTVVLSGDGGDELFFGYSRPESLLRNGADFRWPWPVRVALYANGKYGAGPLRSDVILSRTPGHYYLEVNSRLKDEGLNMIAPALPALPDDFSLYASDKYENVAQLANYSRHVEYYGQLQRCLKKVEMASMFHSLEVRVPLLDREVVEISLRIDPFDCMRNGTRKTVLRELLGRYVPPSIIPQVKRGFAVPLGDWLRGPLRSMVEDTLLGNELLPLGVFDRRGVERYWRTHLNGKRDRKWGLWTLLSLQWWYRSLDRPPVSG